MDGGYRVSGWWDYSSGCDVATHFIGAAIVTEPSGEIDTRWVCFRRDQFEIIDNWDTLGMRGTGSRRVVVHDLFVPERHTVPSPNPFRPVVEFPGRDVHANPMFRGPLASLLISEPAAVCVGIAHAAVDAYIEILTTKHQWGPMSPLRSEVGVFHRLLGEATAYLDTAEAALHHVARLWTDHAERAARTGVPATDEDDRRLILVEQQSIELATKVVDLVFRSSGSSASNRGQRIERYFRDINMVADPHHAPVRSGRGRTSGASGSASPPRCPSEASASGGYGGLGGGARPALLAAGGALGGDADVARTLRDGERELAAGAERVGEDPGAVDLGRRPDLAGDLGDDHVARQLRVGVEGGQPGQGVRVVGVRATDGDGLRPGTGGWHRSELPRPDVA